jgi:hypothetical protein
VLDYLPSFIPLQDWQERNDIGNSSNLNQASHVSSNVSRHLHHGFKPATPVEEAFARAKRSKLRGDPLAQEKLSPGFLVNAKRAVEFVLGRKLVGNEATNLVRSLNVLPRSRQGQVPLYAVEDVRAEYRRRERLD